MIGLLTPYNVNNYGTKLQAYAVQEIVSEFDDTEIITYQPDFWGKVLHKSENIRMKKYADVQAANSQTERLSPQLKNKRNHAIKAFDTKLRIAPTVTGMSALKKQSAKYSAVVCGSDQIWHPVNLPGHIYMLEFVADNVKRVAFSPSFGIGRIPQELFHAYQHRFRHIQYLSVREKSGQNMLKELGYPNAVWTLDPTLVLQENKWMDLADEGAEIVPAEPYIFCYFLGTHEFGRQMAKRLQQKIGFKIVTLPHFKTYTPADEDFADIHLYDVSVQQFVALIKNAAMVCTDSFHGTAFSVLFERDVYCCERHKSADGASTNSRLHSILQLLSMEGRMLSSLGEVETVLQQPVDYPAVLSCLNEKRKETEEFLVHALR